MRRRVIRLGASTLVLSLPSKWVKEQGIKPGTELDIETEGKALRVGTAERWQEPRTAVLDFAKEDWHERRPEKYVQRILATAYKQGADEIIIRCKEKRILDYIEQRIAGFVGIEIVEQRKDALVIRNLVEGIEEESDKVLQRIVILTGHISKESVTAIRTNDRSAIENLLRLERTHNKLVDFAKRTLARKGGAEKEDKYLYSFLVEDERLIDEYKHILQERLLQRRVPRQVVATLEEADSYLQTLLDIFRRQRQEDIKTLSRKYVPLREGIKGVLGEQKSAAMHLHLHNIVVRTYELGETVLEWKLAFPTRPAA